MLGVAVPPVGLALDERRSLAVARPRQCTLGRLIHRQHVVAVDRDAFEAVTLRPVRHVVDRHALFDRHRIRVQVVLADKHDRQALDAGEVERFVEIAGVAGAFAEVGDDDVVDLLHLEGEAEPAATGRFAPSMLVLPKIPSSLTPLWSAESRPLDNPVAFPNICDIIVRGSTPFIRKEPRSRCSGQMKSPSVARSRCRR